MAQGRETNIPAEQSQTSEEAWLSTSHADTRRTSGSQVTPAEGSAPTFGLIWPITNRSVFAALRRGQRVRRGPLTVSFSDGSPAEPPRVAYAIGRKVGSAIERNRLRRRLRAIVRELAPQIRPGAYLIRVAPEAARLSHTELVTNVTEAIQAVNQVGRTTGSSRPQMTGFQ